jgi:DNA-binding response OmpR family regulator
MGENGMQAKILWIEGNRAEGPSFIPDMQQRGFELNSVTTGSAALARLYEFDPDLVVVNAASLRTTGKRICRSIRASSDGVPIVLINDPQHVVDEDCANAVLTLPFTIRKLLNRVIPLVTSEGKKQIHKGPIRLDVELKRVHCQNREARLTPRLTQILQHLMENAGAVVEREVLFRKVWDTEYTGDTRTLDVHINWLRKAIEADPRNPKFLKTLRGVGYRLDV